MLINQVSPDAGGTASPGPIELVGNYDARWSDEAYVGEFEPALYEYTMQDIIIPGHLEDDLLIVVFLHAGDDGLYSSVNAGLEAAWSGWTKINFSDGNDTYGTVYWKIATADQVGTAYWTGPNIYTNTSGVSGRYHSLVWRNCHATTPIDSAGCSWTGSGSGYPDPPALTALDGPGTVHVFGGIKNIRNVGTTPSLTSHSGTLIDDGWTGGDPNQFDDMWSGVAYEFDEGYFDPWRFIVSYNQNYEWLAFHFALRHVEA